MQNEKSEERNAVHEYFKYLKSMWWMLPPVLASVFARRLETNLQIPAFATYVVGYGIMAIALFWHARKVWRKTDAEKRAMQKRFDTEDAALFGAKK